MSAVKQMQAIRSIASSKSNDIMNELEDSGVEFAKGTGHLTIRVIAAAFVTFQLELLEKEEAAEVSKSPPRNDPLSFDLINGKRACFYFYPQDVSEAKEGDIWHDLDGRPHFILGDGWIEARGITPQCAEAQCIEAFTIAGLTSDRAFEVTKGQWWQGRCPENQIHKFKLV